MCNWSRTCHFAKPGNLSRIGKKIKLTAFELGCELNTQVHNFEVVSRQFLYLSKSPSIPAGLWFSIAWATNQCSPIMIDKQLTWTASHIARSPLGILIIPLGAYGDRPIFHKRLDMSHPGSYSPTLKAHILYRWWGLLCPLWREWLIHFSSCQRQNGMMYGRRARVTFDQSIYRCSLNSREISKRTLNAFHIPHYLEP